MEAKTATIIAIINIVFMIKFQSPHLLSLSTNLTMGSHLKSSHFVKIHKGNSVVYKEELV